MFHKFMANRALAVITSRPPDFSVGPSDDPYMLRWWWLPRNRILNIYIHRILHDDDDRALHDHPWASLSYMVGGELLEHYMVKGEPHHIPGKSYTRTRWLIPRDWIYRSPRFAHRLRLISKTATTIFITGPKVREWGFHCPKGWVPWRDFVTPDNPGEIGRGES